MESAEEHVEFTVKVLRMGLARQRGGVLLTRGVYLAAFRLMQVSYLEIYMEKIRDLFAPLEGGGSSGGKHSDASNLRVREDKDGGVFVEGATEFYTASVVRFAHSCRRSEKPCPASRVC